MKTLAKRLAATGIECSIAYAEQISDSTEEADAFSDLLQIPYSEFFRNQLTFSLLEQWILPSLAADKRKAGSGEVRVWSAGCAAGQEIYSIAMLIDEMNESAEDKVAFRLFATDYSSKELALAQHGVYHEDVVRNVRQKHIWKYFAAEGDSYRLNDRIKNLVDFSEYDLLDKESSSPPASIFGDFDLVFCSNLLFYYRTEVQQEILGKICRSMSPNGYLISGEAERDIVSRHECFRAVAPPSAIFQRTKHRGSL